MTSNIDVHSRRKTARIAGVLYLLVVPLGLFGAFYAPSQVIQLQEPAATMNNLVSSELLFRLGIVSDLLASVVMITVAVALYRLLKSVDRNMALLMLVFVVAGAAIAMLNKLNYFAALLLSGAGTAPTGFTAEQSQALAAIFLRMHEIGSAIAYIFWALWLAPLGYLVFKSTFLPRILGILLAISCVGYLVETFATFLGHSLDLALITFWGELLFILWLLIKGVKTEQEV